MFVCLFLSLRCIWPSLFFFTFSEQSSLRWMSGCITFTGQRNTLKIQTILYAKQWSLNSIPMILDIREHEFSRLTALLDYKFTAVSQVNWTKPGRDLIVSTNKTSLQAHTKNIGFFFSCLMHIWVAWFKEGPVVAHGYTLCCANRKKVGEYLKSTNYKAHTKISLFFSCLLHMWVAWL